MIRRVLSLCLVLAALFAAAPAVQVPPQVAFAAATKECTVYVTKTGHKYHRAGCQYLKSSAIKMTRSEAIKGGYSPCKRCGGSGCD